MRFLGLNMGVVVRRDVVVEVIERGKASLRVEMGSMAAILS